MAASGATQPEVLATLRNTVGTLVLNRPKALNSLSHNMVKLTCNALYQWSEPDSRASCIIVKGAGGKAFCAGGDVKALVEVAKNGDVTYPEDFFTAEYKMDLMIAQLAVPYIAVVDGIVMGGGAGASMHGTFRVATERTVFAMPECAIGLFPDVGASFFLNRLPGALGMYLGLTGARLTGVTVRQAGLATHYLPSSAVPELERRVHALGPRAAHFDQVARLLDSLQHEHQPMPDGDLPRTLPWINRHFSQPTVSLMFQSLRQTEQRLSAAVTDDLTTKPELDWTRATLDMLTKGSPLSILVTSELLRRSAHASLATCLASDTAMVAHFVNDRGDFFEGVTAVLMDKRKAVWKHPSVDSVPPQLVESFFVGGPFALHQEPSPAPLRSQTTSARMDAATTRAHDNTSSSSLSCAECFTVLPGHTARPHHALRTPAGSKL